MDPDLYAILGVPADADAGQITRAFRHLIRALHPDTADVAPRDQDAGERLAQVLAAWRVLHDPAARSAYDSSRAAAAAERRAGDYRDGAPVDVREHGHTVLVAGPTVVHARPAGPGGPHIRVGPPIRLDG